LRTKEVGMAVEVEVGVGVEVEVASMVVIGAVM
jgi:hypothetical protein